MDAPQDGHLEWYQHDGFNDGSRVWKGAVEVGHGWNFSKIFSGSDGVVYAIQDDGTVRWYKHNGFTYGGDVSTWISHKVIGNGWGQFKDVFSTGQGAIYAVKTDGTLLLFQHNGFATGDATWENPRSVGNGWQNFQQIIPAGNGVLLAIQTDGKLLWYKDDGGLHISFGNIYERWQEKWEGPIQIGTGWESFKKVTALLPATPQIPH